MVSVDAAEDYLDEIERVQARGLSHDETARALEERAMQRPAGSEDRSGFLDAAGDFWVYAEDTERAEAAFRASIDNGGEADRYAEAALVLLLLRAGRDAEADDILASLLAAARAGTLATTTYEMVGDCLEEAGRLRQALRWYTMPLRDVDPDDLDRGDTVLLHGRRRVRTMLGMPEDRLDLESNRLAAEARARYDPDDELH